MVSQAPETGDPDPGFRIESLEADLAALDAGRPIQRIYVVGCGRSGTWLLTAVLSTFADTEVFPHERDVSYFLRRQTEKSTLVLKRDHLAYRQIDNIPSSIALAYAIRHPFDVLTSHNPRIPENAFHIGRSRWLSEMNALRNLVERGRPNMKIVRYEDLASEPDRVQTELGAAFALEVERPARDFLASFPYSLESEEAMHGLRAIDRNSIGRFRTRPDHIERVKNIRDDLAPMLAWVGQTFDYDLAV